MSTDEYFQQLDHTLESLLGFERYVVARVEGALKDKLRGEGPHDDDGIFSAYTTYVAYCQPRGLAARAARLWLTQLAPLVGWAETELQRAAPGARLHKGSPFYNAGISFFITGDFERAYQFIAEAGIEDELSGRGPRTAILVGGYEISEQVLIAPLMTTLAPMLAPNYTVISGHVLDSTELKGLFSWLSTRGADAFQALIALHRYRKLLMRPSNEAASHIQVRAIADLVVAFESSLRRWQAGLAGQQLHGRAEHLLNCNAIAKASFVAFHTAFLGHWSADKESIQALEWTLTEAVSLLAAAPSLGSRIGVGAYLIARLRNSLMHVLEDGLNLYTDAGLRAGVAGVALGMLRISRHGEEGTLAGIA